jgi:hypothetical protein
MTEKNDDPRLILDGSVTTTVERTSACMTPEDARFFDAFCDVLRTTGGSDTVTPDPEKGEEE